MNFTTDELMVLQIYGEISEKDSRKLDSLFDSDNSLKKDYEELKDIHLSLSGLQLNPDEKIIKNILEHSLYSRRN